MDLEEMIEALKKKGYRVFPPLNDKQNDEADKCAETGNGFCSECSCFVCLAGNDY